MKGKLSSIVLALILVETISFGIFSPRMGFYHDDWALLETWLGSGDIWTFVRAFAAQGFIVRPANLLEFGLMFSAWGLRPFPYQLTMLVLEVLQALLFFEFVRKATGRRSLALWAAVFAMLFPTHAVTHVWLSTSIQTLSIDLVLAAMLLHIRWLETSRAGWLAGAVACYAVGLLTYESSAFLPLMLLAALAVRDVAAGKSASRAFLAAAARVAPLLVPFAAVMFWQRIGFAWYSGSANMRPVGLSPRHVVEAFKSGLACVTYRAARLCARSAALLFREVPIGYLLAWASATAAGAVLLDADADNPSSRSGMRVAAWMVAAGFVAANLPYAVSRDYFPTCVGIMGRTSACGGLVGGLGVAVIVLALGDRGMRALSRAAAGLVVALFLAANWHAALNWGRSWELQSDILAKAAPGATALPKDARVLVGGFPNYLDRGTNEAIVFDASWDISPALRIAAKRADLSADVVSDRTRFEREFVGELRSGKIERRLDYSELHYYRYSENRWYSGEELRKAYHSLALTP